MGRFSRWQFNPLGDPGRKYGTTREPEDRGRNENECCAGKQDNRMD